MYPYPVPVSITSSSPHQEQVQRAGVEFVFVQRPYADPLPVVERWLRENFFGVQDCLADEACERRDEDGDYVNQASDGGQIEGSHVSVGSLGNGAESNHVNEDYSDLDGGRGIHDDQGVSYNHGDGYGESSWVYEDGPSSDVSQGVQSSPSERRDASYLINDSRTEVVLSGIPGPRHESVPSRTWGSMFQLHRTEHSAASFLHASLPNISEEFGVRNRVGYTVQGVDDLSELQREGVDEKETGDVWFEYLDSVSEAAYKNELREQARRDAARGS